MRKNNKICALDKTVYTFCPSCNHKEGANDLWKVMYCCENCRDIDNTLNKYQFGHITKEEAKAKLNTLDTSNKDMYPEYYRNYMREIYSENAADAIISDDFKIEEETDMPKQENITKINNQPYSFEKKNKWNKKNKNIVNKD